MPLVQRVLDAEPVTTLSDYIGRAGGGRALEAARRLGPAAIIDEVDASGLRGRGGAGFPTGRKWRSVADNRSPVLPTSVVVNAAEGEPGTFKDRAILRANPYRVLEGALVAAQALEADSVVVAAKASFTPEVEALRRAIAEITDAGWVEDIGLGVVEGPGEYLYGEETALLEVLDGRPPFPRIAPPYRYGMDEVGTESASAAGTERAGPEGTVAPPTLVNNAETMANVALVVAEGPEWFRSVGTDESPGTIVCTVTGRTRRHGVAEFAMGTPLREVIEEVGGGPIGQRVVAVMSGVASPLLPESLLDTPVSYEGMSEAGSGLGTGGFIVFDDTTDMVAVAQAVSRFLAVESCGQCTPCKQDGLIISDLLDRFRRSEAEESDLEELNSRVGTVSDEARCFLAPQHQAVVGSILRLFPDAVKAHLTGDVPEAEPELVAAMVDLDQGQARLDEEQRSKQPDWSYGDEDSGQSPADRLDTRAGAQAEDRRATSIS
jgi:NADH-quinone oxidoreductase subunit F